MRRPTALLAGVTAALVTGVLVVPTGGAASAASGRDGHRTPTPAAAQRALAHAQEVMSGRAAERARSRVARAAVGRDATIALRDLSLALPVLRGAHLRQARALLARPTDGAADADGDGYAPRAPVQQTCDAHLCLHWVETTVDAVPDADADGDGTPDWVETTMATLQHVWSVEVGDFGYRAPRSDLSSSNNGGNGKLDVYLADVGDKYYGYCTTDDPASRRFDRSAYCVLDNDFDPAQFFGATALDSLRVTAAHEFFHAVQFAYDYAEDRWLVEGSATWMEDQVYDAVNDNYQYLVDSALANPAVPQDRAKYGELSQYGAFVFWQFLSQDLSPSSDSADPSVLRAVWARADAAAGGPDDYALQAVDHVARARGTSLRPLFADFAMVNTVPAAYYEEGDAYARHVPGGGAPMGKVFRLGSSRKSSGTWQARLDHLSSADVRYVPSSTLRGTWQLRLRLDLPGKARGSQARVLVRHTDGTLDVHRVGLSRTGGKTLTVPFTRSQVANVTLTLVNASDRFSCWRSPPTVYSCSGRPADDGQVYTWSGTAVR